jgi:putative nucleotidyltransferase with HDIG domain
MPDIKKTVLVVDDDVMICRSLSALLTQSGYGVELAYNAQEATRIIGTRCFEVAMVDLCLPDADGVSVMLTIKKSCPDTVAILMTGQPSFETVQAALRAGAFDYIVKPFDAAAMGFAVKRAFEMRELIEANRGLLEELSVQNAKLESLVQERTRALTDVYTIGQSILSASLKLDEALSVVVDKISDALKCDICALLLFDKDAQGLRMKASLGLNRDSADNTFIKSGDEISGWVYAGRQSLLVEDLEKDKRFSVRSHEKYYSASLLSVPLIVKDFCIGVLNVNSRASAKPFDKDDLWLLEGLASQAAIAIENARLYASLQDTYMRTILALTTALDAKDHYTKTHSENVTRYATAIAAQMKMPDADIEKIKWACQLHDLGKIGIHDYILTKPGQLTPEEWDEMRQHSLKSAEILRPLEFLEESVVMIEQHHERIDGKGYPFGLKGEDILVGARIIAVVDAYDAMTTDRPYRKALSREAAAGELVANKEKQFDSRVVDVFLRVLADEK